MLPSDLVRCRAAAAPAVVLLHGCAGPYDSRGRLNERLRTAAARLNALGVGALVVDSLMPRGEKELCTQGRHPRDDAGAAPARRPRRAAVAGGAARRRRGAARAHRLVERRDDGSREHEPQACRGRGERAQPALAIALYPGCDAELKRGYEAAAPLLLLVGEADDWTPAAPCKALAQQAGGPPAQIEVYPGAYHGFDVAGRCAGAPTCRTASPGQGVHVGGDPAARAASVLRIDAFVRERFGLTAAKATMKPLLPDRPPRDSTEAELDALRAAVCDRLGGFDDRVSLEWARRLHDRAGRRPARAGAAEWRDAMVGDAYEPRLRRPRGPRRRPSARCRRGWTCCSTSSTPRR